MRHSNSTAPSLLTVKLCKHAWDRIQQRCIPEIIIDLLLDYGQSSWAGPGCERYEFSKRGWKRAVRYLGVQSKYYEMHRNTYIIVDENCTVITAAYRH